MLFLSAVALFGASVALAQSTVTDTSVREEFCRTVLAYSHAGPLPLPRTTSTYPVTLPFSESMTVTKTSTQTITPSMCTSTTTFFSDKRFTTTAKAAVSTLSTTETLTRTKTETQTQTLLLTTTTTAPTVTYTYLVPAPSGFVSISNTENGMPLQGIGKREIARPYGIARRAEANTEAKQLPARVPIKGGSALGAPAAVICAEIDVIRTTVVAVSTAMPVKTTLPPKTSVVSTTVTEISTETVYPSAAQTTITFTQLATLTTTTVSTKTLMKTYGVTPTATVDAYAQCASNNILGPQLPNGDYINNAAYAHGYGVSTSHLTRTDATSCCVACAVLPGCVASFFKVEASDCVLLTSVNPSQCSAGQEGNQAVYFHSSSPAIDGNYAVSNGACGYVSDGNGIYQPQPASYEN